MSLLWKVFWTVIIVVFGATAVGHLGQFFDTLFSADLTWAWLWDFILAILIVLPAWFMWKGTHLIPVIFNFVVRIVIMVLLLGVFPMMGGIDVATVEIPLLGTYNLFTFISIAGIYFFSLWGIWVKS